MRRLPRSITLLLVAILLATVLSPSFAWEAAAGNSAHGDETVAIDGSGHARDHDSQAGGHHDDADTHHHHHACAGHLLGHLPGHIGAAFALAVLDPIRDGFPEPQAGFASAFPDRLDRPPLAPALA